MPQQKCASLKMLGEVMNTNSAATVSSMFPHPNDLFSISVEAGYSMRSTNSGCNATPSLSKQAGDFSALSNNQAKDARSTAVCGGGICTRSQSDGLKDGVPTLNVNPASESSKSAMAADNPKTF
jgi:hypothetical protein